MMHELAYPIVAAPAGDSCAGADRNPHQS
jgi:hypothetical protein